MHSAQKDKAHLPNIRKDTGVEYRDMLFFDDELPNIVKVSHLQMRQCSLQSPRPGEAVHRCCASVCMAAAFAQPWWQYSVVGMYGLRKGLSRDRHVIEAAHKVP